MEIGMGMWKSGWFLFEGLRVYFIGRTEVGWSNTTADI